MRWRDSNGNLAEAWISGPLDYEWSGRVSREIRTARTLRQTPVGSPVGIRRDRGIDKVPQLRKDQGGGAIQSKTAGSKGRGANAKILLYFGGQVLGFARTSSSGSSLMKACEGSLRRSPASSRNGGVVQG